MIPAKSGQFPFFRHALVIPVVAKTIYQCALSCQKMGGLGFGFLFPPLLQYKLHVFKPGKSPKDQLMVM